LRPGGVVVIEHADTQGGQVPWIFTEERGWADAADHPRMARAPVHTERRTPSDTTTFGHGAPIERRGWRHAAPAHRLRWRAWPRPILDGAVSPCTTIPNSSLPRQLGTEEIRKGVWLG
ncbi:hypothetical protein ACFWFQ_32730, partial [Nocardia salmonicida]